MAAQKALDQEDRPATSPSGNGIVHLARRIPWWVSVGLAALVLGFGRSILSGVGTADEAWFLYVLHRVNLGQVLYRDVWVPVFPLAVWLGQAFTSVFGNHVFVLKMVDTLCFTGTAIACVAVARRIAPNSRYAVLILAVMLGWTGPGVIGPGSIYTALAYALTAATLAVILAWVDSGADIRSRSISLLATAAATAGLAFSAKQTIGILAVGAFVATVLVIGGRRGFRRAIGLAFGAGAVSVLVAASTMIPAALSGGLPALLRDTVSSGGSSSYLSMASVPYLTGLVQFLQQLLAPISLGWVGSVTMLGAFIVPIVVVPFFIWALTRNKDARLWVVGIFCVAALAGTYPRADYPHFIAALPFLLLAGIVAWEVLKQYLTDSVIAVAMVLVIVVTGARLTAVVLAPFGTGDYAIVSSRLADFQGSLFTVEEERSADEAVGTLTAASQKHIFILSLRAGLLYLASGREDPTAYDYPDLYGFGSFEQDDVINAVEDGRIEAIWFDSHVLEYLGWEDSRIMAYVRHAMRPYGYATPWGQLYLPAHNQPTRK
jgi:hypothetical protein